MSSSGTGKMRLVTVHLPAKWVEELDRLVAEGRYPNRSEIIRVAIRDFLRSEVWNTRRIEKRREEF